MKLSRALAAPLAFSFALVAVAPAIAEDTNDVQSDPVFSCDTADLSGMTTGEVVNNVMLPGTVFVRTMEAREKPGGGAEGGLENFFERFFGQTPGSDDSDFQYLGLGSGFVVDSAQGYIVTNNHVIEGADRITVTFYDPDSRDNLGKEVVAELVGTDPETDVAVLKVDVDQTLDCVGLADSSTVRVYDDVIAIGNPLGITFTVTGGIVSNANRSGESPYTDYIQTDAAVNQGNSGGPSFNTGGEVIGMNTFIASQSGGSIGLGFAIPADTIERIATQLIVNGEVQRGWLGVRVQPLDDSKAQSLGMSEVQGAFVAGVTDDSPAELAGIEKGDVILSFNGYEINNFDDLLRAVARTPVGDTVDVHIWRDGAEQVLSATVSNRAEALAAESAKDEPKQEEELPAPMPAPAPQPAPLP